MAAPGFRDRIQKHWQTPGPPAADALKAASLLYAAGLQLRDALYRSGRAPVHRLPCAVVSVGNLTVGGTGKTPMTLYLAQLFRSMKLRTAILSRGYKGRCEHDGGIVSDGRRIRMSPRDAGDEPYMMALQLTGIPVLVGRSRFRTGRLAVARFGAEVVVLDDGFQHRRLFRDLDIVLLDRGNPLGNSRLLPCGPLREPPAALSRAHLVVWTRSDTSRDTAPNRAEAVLRRFLQGKTVFQAGHRPRFTRLHGGRPAPWPAENLAGLTAFAFSGIARNADFQRTLEDCGCSLCGFKEFPDHHWFNPREIEALFREARRRGAACVITTEKDAVRWPPDRPPTLPMVIAGIETCFYRQRGRFERCIADRIRPILNKH